MSFSMKKPFMMNVTPDGVAGPRVLDSRRNTDQHPYGKPGFQLSNNYMETHPIEI